MRSHYRCSECGSRYPVAPDLMLCPSCSRQQEPHRPLRGILEVVLEERMPPAASPLELLPVDARFFPPIPVGNTPLWRPRRLREKLGFPNLCLKDDGLNPTGSLKDRASYLVAAFAAQHGISRIAVASTGNAGSSMAGIGAAAGIAVTLFIPRNAPPAKLIQARQYGAELVLVDGNYDAAYDMCLDYAAAEKVLSRNTAHNPMTIEGKKTAALEIIRQLDRSPDCLFVSAGDGVILGGTFKGFRDARDAGTIREIPRIFAVQAEGSSAICRAFESGDFGPPAPASTVADSLAVDVPRGGYYALKQLRENGGACVTVSDEQILKAQRELAAECGLFAEPAAAAALAGFRCVRGSIPAEAVVVLLITGSGLKDTAAAEKALEADNS